MLGDTHVTMEEPVEGGRIDVLWQDFRIAWEVDFSLPTPSEQERRAAVRRAAGMRFVSLIDAADERLQLEHEQRVSILSLMS
ncbi:MAG: hypothetical protein JWN04_407 [Myxococcaceae bacterium]|nr:hypothetical protein [Myxococcaceae bacterium]